VTQKYSQELWNETRRIDEWRVFLRHDFQNKSRLIAYDIVEKLANGYPLSLCEVGFGNAYDFQACFRHLHDAGRIAYTGYDITKLFVFFAGQDYPGYEWRVGSFGDLQPMGYDITYTRHTLEHAEPDIMPICLRELLAATRNTCIITWFLKPSYEHIQQFKTSWVNTYDADAVADVICGCGFGLKIIESGKSDAVYIAERLP